MATVASVLEIIIAICDTPFLYLAKGDGPKLAREEK